MSKVRIVTDSTADIPAALASSLDISVVPCAIYWGQESYRDGLDLSSEEFFDRLALGGELPRTSQPPISEFVATYQRLMEQDQNGGILSIHVAGSLSGTLNAAWAAAQMLPNPSRVTIVDSGQLSMGLGWAVIEAARMAQTGATRAEVDAAVQALLPSLRTAAMIDTLENLYKGGRINQLSAALGDALQIKPLLSVESGQVVVWGKVRTRSRALKHLVDRVQGWGPLTYMAVLHTGAEALAESLVELLADQIPEGRFLTGPAGSAVATHLGLGAVGVCALLAPTSARATFRLPQTDRNDPGAGINPLPGPD
jgi:DegV family protein with EDD domain